MAGKRVFLQFGLRTLLGTMTVAALAGGWFADRMHRREAAIRTIGAAGGTVSSEYSHRTLLKVFLCPSDVDQPVIQRTWRELLFGDNQRGIFFTEDRPLNRQAFAAVAAIVEVRQLGFYEGTLTNEGLAQLRGLRHVETLTIPGSPISDRSAAVLANWQELTWLELDDTLITDAAVPHLIKLQKLQTLRIRGTKITDRGASQLAALPQLQELSLGDSDRHFMPIIIACRDELQAKLPACRLNGTFRAK